MNPMNLLKPPPSSVTVLEARALLDLVKMSTPLARSLLNRSEQSRRQLVVVIPGFGANDRYTWPLRAYLKSLGYATTGWGLGTNKAGLNLPHSLSDVHSRWKLGTKSPYRGEAGVPYVIDRLIDRVDELSEASKQPIALVGWSLGGFMAREVARERPAQISQVITLGSPVIGGPKYTVAAPTFHRRQQDLDWVERTIADREECPITVPITAVVSPSDGVVSYLAALDHHSPAVDHIQLDVAHLALPYNRTVWSVIAKALRTMEPERACA
jgi:pimeloyl-ACP methyl ester carboxylesterase